ncbi:hypothetical protein A3C89_03550 [Candidatus Kaiserbacteria bacterium RIFCSPHIGHO2_02_FULL_50_50]|uniref:Guanylate kinase n=1 Tax=Candidatus Kaiserbacteria bacterium RIFCSPHIGHO2_02_FULL_50_50 TaxID=1798492 RepID=A0A1F6DC15_9BACT|nr:MAG: hypothetical protein A3C89_03550 [Candidatus Kaiserbacteria bacterium RIFCSPHIGHO2_02_FULL_50_50]OGG88536.1 MAG: hypothetical protein A3G62_03440 [Candidatus Kaiserbacteria bacterium RIFCSPLOWO2_12_FULL_50_10]
MQKKGMLILLMGPSGSGKNTLKAHVEKVFGDQLSFVTSYTSRAPRPGEVPGKTYHYVSREEFEALRDAGKFIEWAEYGANYYGIPLDAVQDALENGKILFRELEHKGYQQIKAKLPHDQYRLIFIDGGDWDHLKRRILGRAPMSEEELALRKESYDIEMAIKPEADAVIVNKDGEVAAAERAIERVVREMLER